MGAGGSCMGQSKPEDPPLGGVRTGQDEYLERQVRPAPPTRSNTWLEQNFPKKQLQNYRKEREIGQNVYLGFKSDLHDVDHMFKPSRERAAAVSASVSG
jgi:hypothetical protein